MRAGDLAAVLDAVAPEAASLRAREQGRAIAIPALLAASRRFSPSSDPAATWTWRSGDTVESIPAAPRPEVLVRVVETYRLPPWQASLQERVQWWRLVQVDGQWRLADDAGTAEHPSQLDVWDLGPVGLRAAAHALVVDQPGDPARTTRLLGFAEEAVSRVARDLPPSSWSWPGAALFVRPGDDAAAAHLAGLSSAPAGVTGLAAVTVGPPLGSTAHVVLVPSGADHLSDADLDLVLTHEVVHVATRPVTRASVPLWLAEGFADWIARGRTPVREAAPVVLRRYREDGGGSLSLPDDKDFFSGTPEARESAYELSWLAVRALAEAVGPTGVLAFYREVASGQSVGAALLRQGVPLTAGSQRVGSGGGRSLVQLLARQLRQG